MCPPCPVDPILTATDIADTLSGGISSFFGFLFRATTLPFFIESKPKFSAATAKVGANPWAIAETTHDMLYDSFVSSHLLIPFLPLLP